MEKTINIGGRLHNPAVGGALTGANEIKDDTKGKMQDVINQETDAELLRLDGAKQDKLTFDQTPTEKSTNPVTSGGVYAADAALQQAIEAILLLIPSAASALNQLADKSFVNSSIATATATFRGTYNLITDLELTVSATHQQIATALASVISTADNNDYCFVQIPVSDQSTDIRVTERYKFDGTSWEYEYDLNNSGFTADQWGAINSGITSVLVGKLGGLPTAAELATMFAGKQNTLTFDSTPVAGSDNPVKSSGLYNAFAAINALIPEGADANNKLVAENRLVAYVTTLINALDATFDVTSADGHVTLRMTQADGLITSVQIVTSDIASASALTTLGGRVSTAEADIDALQDAYAALTQSDVVIVEGALPSSGQLQNIIYRQPDQDHTPPQFYSDYMWNGTTWVLMATYMNAIDPRPKKGSQNLVTSGGVFDNMGALDVSELNATDNPHTLAIYADLSAALAAIPSDYQKGGMSVKFVQSSDNKYVQYRLMSNAFSTTESDWQGVDDVPLIEGKNLVNESGIVDYVNRKYFTHCRTQICEILNEIYLTGLDITKGNEYYKLRLMYYEGDKALQIYHDTPVTDNMLAEGYFTDNNFVIINEYGNSGISGAAIINKTDFSTGISYSFIKPDIVSNLINSPTLKLILSNVVSKNDMNNLINNISVFSTTQSAYKWFKIERPIIGDVAIYTTKNYTGQRVAFSNEANVNGNTKVVLMGSNRKYMSVHVDNNANYIGLYCNNTAEAVNFSIIINRVVYPNIFSIIDNLTPNIVVADVNQIQTNKYYDSNCQLQEASGYKVITLNVTKGKYYIVKYSNLSGITGIVDIDSVDRVTKNKAFKVLTIGLSYNKYGLVQARYSKIAMTLFSDDEVDYKYYCLSDYAGTNILADILGQQKKEYIVDINGNEDYTSFIRCWLEHQDEEDITIRLMPGTYDMISELKEIYGNSYFDNFPNPEEQPSGQRDRGPVFKNRVRIIGCPNAKVICHYTGNNDNVKIHFSPINCGAKGYMFENFHLECSNVRYAIHDEYRDSTFNNPYHNVYRNSIFIIDNSNNAAWQSRYVLGGGLGMNGTITIEGNYFKSIASDKPVVGYHNYAADNAQSYIHCFGNYIDGTNGFKFSWYGASTLTTRILLHDNNVGKSTVVVAETQDSTNENIEVIEWNNVVRNS